MDIYGYLKKDHDEVKDLMRVIEELGNSESEKRSELFNKLKEEVLVHSKVEDRLFYERLSSFSETKGKVQHSRK